MEITAKELADLLGGTVEGDPGTRINRPSKIEEGGAGSISFLANAKYESFAYSTTASALLVGHDFLPKHPIPATLIRVKDVYAAVAQLMERFGERPAPNKNGVDASAFIHPNSHLGEDISVGRFAIVEAGARIGAGCQIHDHAYIGRDTTLGPGVVVHTGARILHACQVGANCVIYPNAVVGSEGFGYAPQEDGTYKKIPHLGNVILEEQVEVGANTTIDRGSMGSTIIRRGVKLDNLVQIAHNVEVGENSVVAAQVGIAGSTKIGKNCRIGGQVGFVGHLKIADGSQFQGQTGVQKDLTEPNKAYFGSPALIYQEYARAFLLFKQLPAMEKRLRQLERLIDQKDR